MFLNNGLDAHQVASMFFGNLKNPKTNANYVLKRLSRDGHVRVDKNTSPYTYYSEHDFVRPSVEGYIYFIKEFHKNTYKIGKTKNLENRLRMFNVKLPFEWEIVHSIKVNDYNFVEKLIHKMFADRRIKGTEWFDLTKEDLSIIKNNEFTEEIIDYLLLSEKEAVNG